MAEHAIRAQQKMARNRLGPQTAGFVGRGDIAVFVVQSMEELALIVGR